MPDEKEIPDAEIGAEDEDLAESESGNAEADAEDTPDEVDVSAGDGAEAEEVDEPPRRGRASDTIRRLRQEAQEARREAAENRRRLDEFEARQRAPAPQGETQEQRAQRYALMSPEERMEARLAESQAEFNQRLGLMQFQTMEASDKAAFEAYCAANPRAARFADEVESRLAELRRNGQNIDRRRLYTFIVGEKILARNEGEGARQRKEGARRVARETTRPASPRGDTAATRQTADTAESRRKRLENVQL